MNTSVTPYLNSLWATLIVEESVRLGNCNVCISPGSRITPLAAAAALHPKIESTVHYDERGTAFFALGQAKGSGKASILLSTSGSAVANFMPAVVEAAMDRVPLIILTADRPPELRDTGANQTIDQVKFFSNYAVWQFDLPCPTLDIPPDTLLSIIDHAVFKSENIRKGVVHLNCLFREPFLPDNQDLTENKKSFSFDQFLHKSNSMLNKELENTSFSEINSPIGKDLLLRYTASINSWIKTAAPKTDYRRAAGYSPKSTTQSESILASISKSKKGLIILGNISSKIKSDILMEFLKKLNWPVFADINSGIRPGFDSDIVIHYYDQLLYDSCQLDSFSPDSIIQIGHQIVSKRLLNFLRNCHPEEYVLLTDSNDRIDPNHRITHQIVTDISGYLDLISAEIKRSPKSPVLKSMSKKSVLIDQFLIDEFDLNKPLTEPGIARHLSECIPADTGMFIGSSMPIRYMDMFAARDGNTPVITSNRGASGIDGAIATAAGFAKNINKPMTVLIGDLTLLHDMNSLPLIKSQLHPFVIIVLNNDGGGIFSLLPISRHFKNKNLEQHFSSTHGLKFDKTASMFGFNYSSPPSLKSFISEYSLAIENTTPTIIEISSNRSKNAECLENIKIQILKIT